MNYDKLKISNKQAEEILFELYNIKGVATKLPGEIDFNFRILIENSEKYILKISRPNENENYLDFQQKLLQFIENKAPNFIAPRVVSGKNGDTIFKITDSFGNERNVRLLSWVEGRVWSSVNPQLNDLRYSLGKQCGLLTSALQGFDHVEAHRNFEWDIAKSLWTTSHTNLFKNEELAIIEYFQSLFEKSQKTYSKLRKAVVHNDANDNNVIVSSDLLNPVVHAAIDYGDAIHTQIINDLAIACAYAVMNHNDPLDAALPIIRGYHSTFALQQEELDHLYIAIAMRLVISVTKSAINKIEEPDNSYLLISEQPAWQVLKKWRNISADFACFSFRDVCGFEAHPNNKLFEKWALTQEVTFSELFPTIAKNDILNLNLSVSSKWLGHQKDFNDVELFQFKINQLQNKNPNKIIGGGYLEPRVLYSSKTYDKVGNYGNENRTIHLGVDFWLPSKTPVHSLFDGEVVVAVNNIGYKQYGGLIILKHQVDSFSFFLLYGHLSAAVVNHKVGDYIKKGAKIGELGNSNENGNWSPHLHFQVILSRLDYEDDFLGVAYHNQIDIWKSICPDPNLLFKSKDLEKTKQKSDEDLVNYRKQHLGKSLSLQYDIPIRMVRGDEQYLVDQFGRKYLDTVNNVAHVGHENYEVLNAGREQMALINTNSRYIHNSINELASELIETLPPELSVLHFVNSGSEANELAVRMIKSFTGERDIIVSEVGYHGNSNACIDISSYKFDGKGGCGAPKYTHVFPLPDVFRGKYRNENSSEKYAYEVKKQIDVIQQQGRGVGALILEPIISCGGQIELPKGFLSKAYKYIREAGGLCVSDEVQTGCGRVGKAFWGFQLHNVIPDIVTIGKPLGNGHPIAAVACTQEVADKFANGMEYFNTFGGNPVSCAIATQVIRTVKHKNLQENALKVGDALKIAFKKLAKEYPIIGDVRGQGLFLGVELVDSNKNPLPKKAAYMVNRMKSYGILMSTDGPDNNVLKIKPPIIFTIQNVEELVSYFKKVIAEDFMLQID